MNHGAATITTRTLPAAGGKLSALARNRDHREIRTEHRARSAGAQSALGRKPASERTFKPVLRISIRRGRCSSNLPWGSPTRSGGQRARQGIARWSSDRAMDAIRERFGRDAVGYAGAALERGPFGPRSLRELAEKDLGDQDG